MPCKNFCLNKLNNDEILETFVNELFESNIINEGATAGLAFVLGIDNVKEIKPVKVTDTNIGKDKYTIY